MGGMGQTVRVADAQRFSKDIFWIQESNRVVDRSGSGSRRHILGVVGFLSMALPVGARCFVAAERL